MKIRSTLALAVLSFAALLSACDEEQVTGPGFICDVTNPVQDIFLAPTATSVLVHSPAQAGDTIQIVAITTNRFGTVRADVPIKFTSSDATVATVDSLGIVHAVAPGTVTIKAAACGESKSVAITVVASVATVTVTPQQDTVIAGDTATFVAHAKGPDGDPVANVEFTFSTTGTGATVIQVNDSTARIATNANGTVGVVARGEGATGTATLLVLPRIFLAGSAAANTIDAGDATTCGIISLGRAYCWGLNSHGQLGAATDTVCFGIPDLIPPKSSGGPSPCSLIPRNVSDSISFVTISAGDSATCGVATTGRAYCWGMGERGYLGNGNPGDAQEPKLVTAALSFSSISVGGRHACALTTSGAAYCWGDDLFGQLGDARLLHSTTPIPVSSGGELPQVFASISAGMRHTCGLTADGTAYCWGDNTFGQLGNGGGSTETPSLVATGVKFASISAGGDHTCGLSTSGAAFCWGDNTAGQLGTGVIGGSSQVPVAVSGGQVFTRISASSGTRVTDPATGVAFKEGRGHTCAITAAGAAYCWGENLDLQLGQGPNTGSDGANPVPSLVRADLSVGNVNFVSITTGSRHSCGIDTNGNAYCWGSNVFGALGNTLQAAFRGLPQKVATPR
jgi:alpha-tubulin suppressor-like RCC1 family protein